MGGGAPCGIRRPLVNGKVLARAAADVQIERLTAGLQGSSMSSDPRVVLLETRVFPRPVPLHSPFIPPPHRTHPPPLLLTFSPASSLLAGYPTPRGPPAPRHAHSPLAHPQVWVPDVT